MPYAPLWSAIDMDLIDTNVSIFSQAYVESTHRVNKEIGFRKNPVRAIADRIRELETGNF